MQPMHIAKPVIWINSQTMVVSFNLNHVLKSMFFHVFPCIFLCFFNVFHVFPIPEILVAQRPCLGDGGSTNQPGPLEIFHLWGANLGRLTAGLYGVGSPRAQQLGWRCLGREPLVAHPRNQLLGRLIMARPVGLNYEIFQGFNGYI